MTAHETAIFGSLVTSDDDHAVVTDADREAFASDVKEFIGMHRRIENQILLMGSWIIDMQQKYGKKFAALCAEALPGLSADTRENYVALATWKANDIASYENWRTAEPSIAIRAELAKVANRLEGEGVDTEEIRAAIADRYPVVYARRKGKSLLGDGNGTASAEPTLTFTADVAPGLCNLVSTGRLTVQVAEQVYSVASAAFPRAARIIAKHGALDNDAAQALDLVAQRIDKSQREGQQFADILAQADYGSIVLADGEQVPVYSVTGREIVHAYEKACKEQEISGVDTPQGKQLIKDEIDLQTVTHIASLLNAENVITLLETMKSNSWFTLLVKTVPEEL